MHGLRASLQNRPLLVLVVLAVATTAQAFDGVQMILARDGRSLLDSTNVTDATVAITVPSVCAAGTISSSLGFSCAVACSTSGIVKLTRMQNVTQNKATDLE